MKWWSDQNGFHGGFLGGRLEVLSSLKLQSHKSGIETVDEVGVDQPIRDL